MERHADPVIGPNRVPRPPLGLGLTDADDGGQASVDRSTGLGADLRVGFTLIGAALAVSHDHQRCAEVAQQRR